MSLPPIGIPVPAPLHPNNWNRPAGNAEFRVTQTFAQVNAAFSPLRHGALDLGNGRLGAPITAPAAGIILAEGYVREPWSTPSTRWGTGNYGGIMVVIGHDNGYVSALAHLSATVVNKGQHVTAGQRVGTLGDSGAARDMGGHVHWDLYHNNIKVDAWPLLAQNYAVKEATTLFSDVPTTSPYYADIKWMADTGITTGIGDGKFGPKLPVTREQLAAFMHRLAEVLAKKG